MNFEVIKHPKCSPDVLLYEVFLDGENIGAIAKNNDTGKYEYASLVRIWGGQSDILQDAENEFRRFCIAYSNIKRCEERIAYLKTKL